MDGRESVTVLKRDALGRVEREERDGRVRVRRVACGGRAPGSAWVARRLLARERRALLALAERAELEGLVPRVEADGASGAVLVRSWIAGVPLSRAESLPVDFFDRLDRLVERVHAAGVCHNDLHKEQNVLVRPDGRPALVDFQLASVHRARTRAFESRARDDLRHVQKHRRRYLALGRGPAGAAGSDPEADARARIERGLGHGLGRSPLAWLWRRLAKPVYRFVTRGLLGTRDGEERRPSSGPWPRWTPPAGS
jgi:RIO-like serine/threonine protein kinase